MSNVSHSSEARILIFVSTFTTPVDELTVFQRQLKFTSVYGKYMSKFLISQETDQKKRVKKVTRPESKMKRVQKFEDNWDCELVVDQKQKTDNIQQSSIVGLSVIEKCAALKTAITTRFYFSKSAQNDVHCTDAKTTCPHEPGSDSKTPIGTSDKELTDKLKKFSEESEGNKSVCVEIPAENERTDLQDTDDGTSMQDDSMDETRVVKLTDSKNNSFTDVIDDFSFFSIKDEPKENESQTETDNEFQKFSEESEGKEGNCMNISAEVGLADAHGTGSGTNRQDASENETSFEVLMENGTMDELQTLSEESERNETDSVNNDCPSECNSVLQETDRGTVVQNDTDGETRVVKLEELGAFSFLDAPNQMSCVSTKDKPEENESQCELLMKIGANDKLQKFSEELEENEADCVNVPEEVGLGGVQGTRSETNRQDESDDETPMEEVNEIRAKDNLETFSEESEENETGCVNTPADVGRSDAQGTQDESGNETRVSIKENGTSSTEVSTRVEKSIVQSVVSENNSLDDSIADKRNSGKRQISAPPVRRSTRLKTRGGKE